MTLVRAMGFGASNTILIGRIPYVRDGVARECWLVVVVSRVVGIVICHVCR
jgi:hypothetical protein